MIKLNPKRNVPFTLLVLCAATLFLAVTPFARAQRVVDLKKMPEATSNRPQQFEVASIRKDPRPFMPSDIPLNAEDYFPPHGAVISEHGTLAGYLIFAYKITDAIQYPLLEAQLPNWAKEEWFGIQATVEGNPSKDEIRVMMQNLLIDRFELKAHQEVKQTPVYSLVLDIPGQLGLQLKAHPNDLLCNERPEKKVSPSKVWIPAPFCGVMFWDNKNLTHMRMMGFTMDQIAGQLARVGAKVGGLDQRSILDRTGLMGKFDLDLEFLREADQSKSAGEADSNVPGADFVHALKSQAGLRLAKITGPVETLVVERIERPSDN